MRCANGWTEVICRCKEYSKGRRCSRIEKLDSREGIIGQHGKWLTAHQNNDSVFPHWRVLNDELVVFLQGGATEQKQLGR